MKRLLAALLLAGAVSAAHAQNLPIGPSGTVVPAVVKLGQANIPFVLLPSGSIGNNGAWTTSNAAQATAYPNAYCFVPLHAISASSAAGWYYCTFSTTQAATLFNNTYTSGTPTIPASPTPFVTTGPGAYTQTTGSNIASYTLAIAGNTIGLNGTVHIEGNVSHNNSAGNKILTTNYDSYAFGTFTDTTSLNRALIGGFSNRGATNVQVPLSNSSLAVPATGSAGALTYGAIDSTATKNLVFNLQIASGSDGMVLESAAVELMPGVP